MITMTAAATGFFLLVGLMALGLHVAFVMFAISMLGAIFYLGWPATLEFGTQYWGATNNFVLVAIPLFVLLGELLVRGGSDLNRYYGPQSAQDELEAELTARAERDAQDEQGVRP